MINFSMDEKAEYKPSSKKAFLFVGRFQPFHNGHLQAVKFVFDKLKVPAILCQVRSNKVTSPFPPSLMEKMMKDVVKNEKMVAEFLEAPSGLTPVIIKQIQDKFGYDVIGLGCGNDRLASYTSHVKFMHSEKTDVGITPDFEIVETPRTMSGTAVREMITKGNDKEFKKAVPSYLHKYYQEFQKVLEGEEELPQGELRSLISLDEFRDNYIREEKGKIATPKGPWKIVSQSGKKKVIVYSVPEGIFDSQGEANKVMKDPMESWIKGAISKHGLKLKVEHSEGKYSLLILGIPTAVSDAEIGGWITKGSR